MDDFPGLLARDFGFKPQGRSVPMAASKGTGGGGAGTLNFGIGSGAGNDSNIRGKSGWNSNPNSFLDDHDGIFGGGSTGGNQKTTTKDYDDVFGGPPKYTTNSSSLDGSSSFDYDSIFQGGSATTTNDNTRKDSFFSVGGGGVPKSSSSLPVYDKPVYDDDDIFDGIPGLKNMSSSSSMKYDDVFSSASSPPKQKGPFYDDLLGDLGKTEPKLKKDSTVKRDDQSGFDDLIPGFGGRSPPPRDRGTAETNKAQQSTVHSTKATSSSGIDDPFGGLDSTSTPVYASSGLFSDPLEQISKPSNSGGTKVDASSVSGGIFDDMDPLAGLGKTVPSLSSDMNDSMKDRSPQRTGPNKTTAQNFAGKGSTESTSQKRVPDDHYRESRPMMFDMRNISADSNKPSGRNDSSQSSFANANPSETNSHVDRSPKSEDNLEAAADEIWLTVSEVPLFTQPTSAPPPSRPPPRPAQYSNGTRTASTKKVNEFSSQHFTQNFQRPKDVTETVRSPGVSSIDELEDFAMGKPRNNTNEHGDVLSSDEELEMNSAAAASAAAMKEAMDRAEAKFKHAKEVRERESAKTGYTGRNRVPGQQERDDKVTQEAQERDLREKQERLDHEREQREREQRQLEKDRERAREIEREKEKARQAVERATREARERAAAEARQKAERAAVGKANAEARERAERAAVQRAHAEARERAAAEARERAERTAAEARMKAQSEAKEKAAAVARAEAEVRLRAERSAVDRAAAEARQRAAAAAARESQQKNENDLESFFSMGARPSSAPKARTTTSNSAFDAQFQQKGPEVPQRTSSGTSASMRKASSATNIVDDLSSIFGAAATPSGEFQEVDGESEERRKARMVRHQRTQERALKALAEKNERDLQVQREQAERHRIAETLDAEIKRWAAGKETNLRALLSTLQYVLWPECGWQPVSLTDLITGASVKKVYRKATLCIHPDKVQQKGANLQQKYIAEKVFDLLKEAWNKFNSEELF